MVNSNVDFKPRTRTPPRSSGFGIRTAITARTFGLTIILLDPPVPHDQPVASCFFDKIVKPSAEFIGAPAGRFDIRDADTAVRLRNERIVTPYGLIPLKLGKDIRRIYRSLIS